MFPNFRSLAKVATAVLALSVPMSASAVTIFTDSFASTTFGSAWTRSGAGPYRIQTSTTYRDGTTGYGVTLDGTSSNVYETSRLDLKLNLASYSNVVLTYRVRNVGEEAHTDDGVYLSTNNGASYVKIGSYPAISSTWSTQTLNLSTLASNNGLLLGPNTIIRWQQYDNYPLSSDGLAIDTVNVTGDIVKSNRAGMGPIQYTGGTAFRVWAPNASAVAVSGTFNGWSANANMLANEGNGNWSADVNGVVKGDQYKYVITNGANTLWKQDPRSLQITNSVGNSVVMDTAYSWVNSFGTPGFNEQLIYQMHIGTFNDSVGGGPGTFASAQSKLAHVQDLGFNMVQLLPIAEFAADFSWGYNPAYPMAPESAYGTPQALKAFVDDAHGKGMGVILDVVHNHYGPSDLSMWQFDGWSTNGKGGIYFFQDWRSSTPWGDTRPDYGRGEVRQYISDSVFVFLNDYRMDGLRWDSTVNIRTQNNGGGGDISDGWTLMQWINNSIDGYSPWKISIAEDLQNNEWMTKTTGSGGAGFDSQWDANFVHPIRDTVITGNDGDRNMFTVRDAVSRWYNGSHTQRVIYTESHDEVANGKSRVPEMIWPGNAGSWFSKKRSTLGGALVFTSPGIPMMFQGQEFLEDGYFADTDPLDWNKNTTYAGIKSLYRDLARLRRNWYNNTRGLRGNNCNVFHVNNTNKLVAFHRWEVGGAGDDVVVIANFANTSYSSYNIGFPRGGTWYVRFNSDWNGYSSDFGNWNSYNTTANSGAKDGLGFNGNVGIGPYSVVIMSQ